MKLDTNKIRFLGLSVKKWHLYLILPLLGVILVGCAAGLLMLGSSALSGSSGGTNTHSSGSSVVMKSISGLVFSQGSANSIAPLGGATVTAQWGGTKGVTKSPAKQKQTTTNSDGSYELDGIDPNVIVNVIIEKDGHETQNQTVNTSEANPKAKGIMNRKNQNKKTIFKNTANDINTAQDTNDKGESLPLSHIIIPLGALTDDTEVELTPYFSMNNLPAPVPDGFIGLAGADFSSSVAATFASGKEAKVYIILSDVIRSEDLSNADIKLMEFVNGNWVIVKDATNQDKKCKYYESGSYQGCLGPDDDAQETEQAKITAVNPFCFVHRISQQATIKGTVTDSSNHPINGAMVFGGGSSTSTDALGKYTLSRIIVLSNTLDTLIIVNAIAPNYQLSSAAAAVNKTTFVADNINIILVTLTEDVAIIGGQVNDTVTSASIPGAKVTCSSDPESAAFIYDNKNSLDLSDDVISVTPHTGALYQWWITSPGASKFRSSQSSNFVVINDLFLESRFNMLGAYRVDLEIVLSDKTIPVMAGFLLQIVGLNLRLTDIKLPISFESSVTLESTSNNNGIYRLIGVPCGVALQLQASKSGYQSSAIRNLTGLSSGQTKEENFSISQGVSQIASIKINPSPSVSLVSNQQVQFSANAYDNAGNTISPTTFTWISSTPAIASINSSGFLTALASGTTIIHASSNGVSSNQVTVYVSSGVPNTPSNLITTTVTASSITIQWQDNSNDETSFKIERSTDGISYTLRSTLNANTISYYDSSLLSNATYYYRVYASNASGNSGYSNSVSVTTLPPPKPSATTNYATNITTNSATLNGQVNPNGLATTAYFEWGLTISYGTNTTSQSVGNDTVNVFVSDNISNLTQNTYNFRIVATNASGTTNGANQTFGTSSGLPPTCTTNPATNITSNSATLNGMVNPNGSDTTTYFEGGPTISYGNTTPSQNIGSGTTSVAVSFNVTDIPANTMIYYRVVGTNAYGTTNGNNQTFTTSGAPPAQVTAPTPADAAINVPINQQLSWVSANGATSYDVYFGTTLPGTPNSSNQSGTTYNPGTLNNSTLYYWRIDSKNASGTTQGYVWSFTTQAPTPPAQVTSPDPANGATGISTSPTLSWGVATGATSYDVYAANFTPPAYQTNTTQLTYYPGTLSYNTVYYWRIDSKNSNGTTAGTIWSFTTQASNTPTQVTLSSPANNATDVLTNTALTWVVASGATSYDVWYDISPTLTYRTNVASPAVNYYPSQPLTPNTTYCWRIDSKNANGTTTGIVWSFTTIGAPAQVNLSSPTNNATGVSTNTALIWVVASGATSYDVYAGINNPPTYQTNTTQLTYYPGTLSYNTIYYWRIDSKNAVGTTTGIVWSFTTQASNTPAQVNLSSPTNNATGVPTTTALTWVVASGADSYDVYYDISPTLTYRTNITSPSVNYNPSQPLAANTTYCWRIDSKNAYGTTNGIVWSFTTIGGGPPPQVTTPTPSNGLTGVSTSTSLTWVAASGATSYDVYAGINNPPTYQTNTTQLTYYPGTLSYNTTYYWRIDSKNANGTTTGIVWSFTTQANTPPQVTLSSPTNNATGVLTNTGLTWALASGATSYDVWYDISPTLTYRTNVNSPTVTYYPSQPLAANTIYCWRIDSKNANGTTTGIVWSFTTVSGGGGPSQVTTPTPSNGVTGVSTTTSLAWVAASGATSYDVYVGNSTPPPYQYNTTQLTYYPGTLSYNTVYYWRIDSKNASGTTTGIVWNFKTIDANVTFYYTGAQQTWIVPSGVTVITATVLGAQGGSVGSTTGAKGAKVVTTLTVASGETLYIYVGGVGGSTTTTASGAGGYNGGGTGGNGNTKGGGGGGGASDIRRTPYTFADRIAIAGGGGGAGKNWGGGTGGYNGSNGISGVYGGGGGSQSSGGVGGDLGGLAGSYGQGGNGVGGGTYGGGGGGSGYYGGGGGGANSTGNGGGGGSSYSVTTTPTPTYTSGYQSGNGQIIITY